MLNVSFFSSEIIFQSFEFIKKENPKWRENYEFIYVFEGVYTMKLYKVLTRGVRFDEIV